MIRIPGSGMVGDVPANCPPCSTAAGTGLGVVGGTFALVFGAFAGFALGGGLLFDDMARRNLAKKNVRR